MVSETTPVGEVRVKWPAHAGRGALPINQFIVQHGPPIGLTAQGDQSFYLLFGHLAPPIVRDERDAQALTDRGEIDVDLRAELFMTRARAEELLKALETALTTEPTFLQESQ